jgi:hypothetical protein
VRGLWIFEMEMKGVDVQVSCQLSIAIAAIANFLAVAGLVILELRSKTLSFSPTFSNVLPFSTFSRVQR